MALPGKNTRGSLLITGPAPPVPQQMSGFLSMFGIGDNKPAPYTPPKQELPDIPLPGVSPSEDEPTSIIETQPQPPVVQPGPNTSNPKFYAAPLDLPSNSPPAARGGVGVPKKRQVAKRPGQAQPAVPAPVPSSTPPETPKPQAPEIEPKLVVAPVPVPVPVPEIPLPTRTESNSNVPKPVEPSSNPAPVKPTGPTQPASRGGTRKAPRAVRPGQGVTTVVEDPPSQEPQSREPVPSEPRTVPPSVIPDSAEKKPEPQAPQPPAQVTSTQAHPPTQIHTRKAPTRKEKPQEPPEPDEQMIEAALAKFVSPHEHDKESLKQLEEKQTNLTGEKQSILQQLAALEEQKKELLEAQSAAVDAGNYEEAEKIDGSLNDLRLFGKELHQQSIDLAQKWIAVEAEKKQIFEQCINAHGDSQAYLKNLTDQTSVLKSKVQAQIDLLLAKLKIHQDLEDKIQKVAQESHSQISDYQSLVGGCDQVIKEQEDELELQLSERKEMDDVWAEIEYFTQEIADVSSKVSSLRKEIRDIENNIKTIKEVTLVGLEQEKKNAVAVKNFRHATTLSAEMKHVEEQIEVQTQLKIQKEAEVKKVQESNSTMTQELATAREKVEALEQKAANSLVALLKKGPTKTEMEPRKSKPESTPVESPSVEDSIPEPTKEPKPAGSDSPEAKEHQPNQAEAPTEEPKTQPEEPQPTEEPKTQPEEPQPTEGPKIQPEESEPTNDSTQPENNTPDPNTAEDREAEPEQSTETNEEKQPKEGDQEPQSDESQ